MEYFLSCDWGTTSLRIRLADVKNAGVLAEEKSQEGIGDTFNRWQENRSQEQGKRIRFYFDVLKPHISKIEKKINQSLAGVKLVISGMASSSIGIMDIPYALAPIGISGKGITSEFIAASKHFDHDVLIISGVKTHDDVMRGEEAQLIGCIDENEKIENAVYVFPGTHSKHVFIKDNQIVSIRTFMTGEVFELLSQRSILKNGVEKNESADLARFKKGVQDSIGENLLHSVFKVRTNHLFNIYNKQDNFNYLSGLLIGAELMDLINYNGDTINLIGGSNLHAHYHAALLELEFSKIIHTFPSQWVDEAAVRGQLKIGRQLKILV